MSFPAGGLRIDWTSQSARRASLHLFGEMLRVIKKQITCIDQKAVDGFDVLPLVWMSFVHHLFDEFVDTPRNNIPSFCFM